MIFGNLHLASFGRCKVVSWKNNIFTDFERKELSYRGRILAAVEVPTIRTIEATILVRGSTVHDVDGKLMDIGQWLYDAGTAKLFAERDTNHYYLARCTSVSKPERSGASARITVVFTCADNRLYNASDDQPIVTATSEMSNFTFNGKHCLNDMGCIFVMDSFDVLAKAKLNKYEIAGNSGTIRYDSGEGILFSEKSLSGTLYFVKQSIDGLMNEDEIIQRMYSVASWLGNAGRGRLSFDNDVTRYYEAEVESNQVFSRSNWENGSIKLKMVLQPYAISFAPKSVSMHAELTANVDTSIPITSFYVGYTTPLTIEITNNGDTSITDLCIKYRNEINALKTMRLKSNGFALSSGETISIDGLSGDITKGAASGVKWLESGDFPVVSVNGAKQILLISSTDASVHVSVKCYERWL